MRFVRGLLAFAVSGLCTTAIAGTALAHEILLNFDQTAEVDETVRIEFTLGHFPADHDHEHTFFQQVGAAELAVLGADGAILPLDYELEGDRYGAEFVPGEPGVYWVIARVARGVVDRSDRTPPAGMQLRYYDAKAPLRVGEAPAPALGATPLHVEIQGDAIATAVDESVRVTVDYRGRAVGGQTVLLVSPTERAREVETDGSGAVELSFNEAGIWMIKTTLVDEDREGTYGGTAYDRVRYNSALYLQIEE